DLGWTFDDMIRTTRQQQRPYFKPQDLTASRQKARYSDTGFQLLIRILETVSGNSFDELLTERIFDPLSLTSTWLPRHRRLALEVEPSPLYTKQRRVRSEERRVGKECRGRWAHGHKDKEYVHEVDMR